MLKGIVNLFGWEKVCDTQVVTPAVAPCDPVKTAMEREDIKAAAHYWRLRIANARIGGALDASRKTTVSSAFTEAELDRFEEAMADQLARVLVMVDNSPLFTERGLDVSLYVYCVASSIGLGSKLAYPGFFTRLRILLGKDVAYELPPFRSGEWVSIWSASDCAATRAEDR